MLLRLQTRTGGGSWQVCDPRSEMQAFLARNRETNGNLKAIGRIMRIWKRHNRVPIGGMLIDTFAFNFIGSWEHRDKSYLYHDFLGRDFLQFMALRDTSQAYWSAPGSGSRVYRSGNFQRPAEVAYQSALKAIQNETNNSVLGWNSSLAINLRKPLSRVSPATTRKPPESQIRECFGRVVYSHNARKRRRPLRPYTSKI
jgi:hypothetical protein